MIDIIGYTKRRRLSVNDHSAKIVRELFVFGRTFTFTYGRAMRRWEIEQAMRGDD